MGNGIPTSSACPGVGIKASASNAARNRGQGRCVMGKLLSLVRTSKAQPGLEGQGGVEVQLRVQRALDVPGLAEPVLFPREQQIRDREALPPEGCHHHLGLVRWYDPVLASLEERDRDR